LLPGPTDLAPRCVMGLIFLLIKPVSFSSCALSALARMLPRHETMRHGLALLECSRDRLDDSASHYCAPANATGGLCGQQPRAFCIARGYLRRANLCMRQTRRIAIQQSTKVELVMTSRPVDLPQWYGVLSRNPSTKHCYPSARPAAVS
jgi:hypothetical protein